jgi:hypothetical protein
LDVLLVPPCTHPDATLVRWLVDRGARPQKLLKKLMKMTAGSQEDPLAWIDRRIAVLELLAPFGPEGDTDDL